MRRRAWPWALALALLAAAALRFAGLSYGLPHAFNADEPHLVNLAVSFGRGSLDPYSFKYPTLWPTLLFLGYGLYFLAWSGLGFLRGAGDFAALFAWEPTGFYLIGRGLAAGFSLAALAVLARLESERRQSERLAAGPPWAALLLAFSPVIVELAHAAKPDCALLFFSACAWLWALRVFRGRGRGAYWACGACLGLALSCQYTAAPLFLVLPLAHFLGRTPTKRRWLIEGGAAAAAGFLLGSPYALLDFPKFWASLQDHATLTQTPMGGQGGVWRDVFFNLWSFAGTGSIAGLAALAGLWRLARRQRGLALVLAGPIAAYALFLGRMPDGAWARYLLGCFPALALLSADGLAAFCAGRKAWAGALAAAAALGPGAYLSWEFDHGLMLPDTREQAAAWVAAHVPPGARILADYPHASPRLRLAKDELVELERKTRAAGSPRARLFSAMAQSHPGGGYWVYRLWRSPADLRSNPAHVAQSAADAAILDVREGLKEARKAGVQYVITSSFGAAPGRSPELALFFDDLKRGGTVLAEFLPEPGVRAGPLLRIYRLGGGISYTLPHGY